MEKITIFDNERLDDLEIDGAKLIQHKEGYSFSSDSVLLANFVKVSQKDIVCDLGSGSGVIPIILAVKKNPAHIYGVEIQKNMFDLSIKNIKLNNLEEKITILNEDLKNISLKNNTMNVVVTNPPYFKGGQIPQNETIAISRNEIKCTLEDVVSTAAKLLKFRGRLYIAYKVSRIVDLFEMLSKYKLETKTVYTIQPKASKEVDLVIVEAIKGAKREAHMYNFVVYNEDGSYTDAAKRLYSK